MDENKKEGRCEYCNQTVFPGEGYCWRGKNSWKLVHEECLQKLLDSLKGKKNGCN